MSRILMNVACVPVLLLAGCGDAGIEESGSTAQPPLSAASSSPAAPREPAPTDLTCAGSLRVSTAGGIYPQGRGPQGFATAAQAVESWIGDGSTFGLGTAYLLSDDASSAWLLRENGTAYARVPIWKQDGKFSVHGYEACDGLIQ